MKYYPALIVLAVTSVAFCNGDYPPNNGSFVKDLPAPPPSSESRITNGVQAKTGELPYVVGLHLHSSGGAWFCGGSIIGHFWVLTAAHCTHDASEVTIHYGSTRLSQPLYTHTVARSNFIGNPGFPNDNDIALIRTPYVEYTRYVNRIALPRFADRDRKYVGAYARVSGWGKTSDGPTGVSNDLNYVDLRVITNEDCERYFGYITDNIICTDTTGGKSSCSGDSGGPLVLRSENVLVGVVGFVPGAGCTVGGPAGFARVTTYLDWIKQHTDIANC